MGAAVAPRVVIAPLREDIHRLATAPTTTPSAAEEPGVSSIATTLLRRPSHEGQTQRRCYTNFGYIRNAY